MASVAGARARGGWSARLRRGGNGGGEIRAVGVSASSGDSRNARRKMRHVRIRKTVWRKGNKKGGGEEGVGEKRERKEEEMRERERERKRKNVT